MSEFRRSTALPFLEARRSCLENHCYRPHAHDSLSIGAIDAGTSVLTGPLDGVIRLAPGDVIVIPAHQVHACNPDRGRWVYQMIHLDQAWAGGLAPGGDASDLFRAVTVLRHRDLYARLSELNDAIFADAASEPLTGIVAALLADLGAAVPTHRAASHADPALLGRLAPVLDRLRTDESNPALSELAALVEMTDFQLIRAMRRTTGLSPLAWRQNARIVEARRMLVAGRPIAETAHALGFSDQSHFHRIFRAHVAASPGSYRG